MMQRSLAMRLRVLRAERGLSLTEAAERAGIQRQTLALLERGERHPHDPTLAKIAKGYGVPVKDLLEEPALAGKAEAPQLGLSVDSTEEVITFDDDAVRAAINSAKAGKLTRKEAARAIADSVRGGPADALEDAVELLLEHAERRRSEGREAAKT
jgi:transcriptional regulator with XRE-family HTH domain